MAETKRITTPDIVIENNSKEIKKLNHKLKKVQYEVSRVDKEIRNLIKYTNKKLK